MKTSIVTRVVISADEGKMLTNGEIYGKSIYLAEDVSVDDFYEISEDEYNEIMKEREEITES